jgi:hypothetical protein
MDLLATLWFLFAADRVGFFSTGPKRTILLTFFAFASLC